MRDTINFKEETLTVLENHGKTWDDVKFIQNDQWRVHDKNKFLEYMDFEYDNGFGGARIPEDLKIVGDNWWLERGEYDGSEWWEFKTMPKPRERVEDVFLSHNGYHGILYERVFWAQKK